MTPQGPAEGNEARRTILRAAEQVFALRGVEDATVREIARRAGYDHGLQYFYFGGKRGLHRQILRDFWRRPVALLADPRLRAPDGGPDYRRLLPALHDFCAANVDRVCVLMRAAFEDGPGLVQLGGEPLRAFFDSLLAEVRAEADSGRLPPVDPHHFIVNQAGLHVLYYAVARSLGRMLGEDLLSPERLERHKREAVRLALHGIEPAEPPPETDDDRAPEAEPPDPSFLEGLMESWRRDWTPGRDRLLGAAETVFSERGYRAATTREIARRAGRDRRMLSFGFANKEDLHRAVMIRFLVSLVEKGSPASDWKAETEEIHGRDMAMFIRFAAANPVPFRLFSRELFGDGERVAKAMGPLLRAIHAQDEPGLAHEQERGRTVRYDIAHFQICTVAMNAYYFMMADFYRALWGVDFLSPERVALQERESLRLILRGIEGPAR